MRRPSAFGRNLALTVTVHGCEAAAGARTRASLIAALTLFAALTLVAALVLISLVAVCHFDLRKLNKSTQAPRVKFQFGYPSGGAR